MHFGLFDHIPDCISSLFIVTGDKRRALYEFTSVNDDELDFNQGDEIEVGILPI